MNAEENRLAPLHAFYDKANFTLRLALFAAIAWPVAAIIAAMFLTPYNAQMVVPLIELSPLIVLFLFVISAPFGLALLLKNPLVKQGFVWLCALIGVELSIGVYFAIIPVSNDTGLIPLLILATSAVFFLRIAKYARFLTFLLSLLLIAISIAFIAGGRAKVIKQFETDSSQQSNFQALVANINPPRICDDSSEDSHDFTTSNTDRISLTLPDGCFSPRIILPNAMDLYGWYFQPKKPDANWWIAFWFAGESKPRGPFGQNDKPNFRSDPPPVSTQFRLQGHGTAVFFTNLPVSHANVPSPSDGSDQKPVAQTVKEFTPQWTAAAQIALEDFVITAAPCIRRAGRVHCFFRLINKGNDVGGELDNHDWGDLNHTRMIDDQGKVYVASAVYLGSSTSISRAQNTIPSNVPVLASAVFENVTGTAVALFDIKLNLSDHFNHQLKIKFRDLPIQQESP